MGDRPTIADVAAKAGVSIATVDRVLNERHPVREQTARRVYEAASEIGYHAASLLRQRLTAVLPHVEFGILLQRPQQAFYRNFGEEVTRAVERTPGIRGRCNLRYVAEPTPAGVVRELEALAETADVVALTSIDHHTVTKAVETLKGTKIPVFSLLSDFAQGVRESYVGLDNLKVGRTAAWLIARTARLPGKVAVFVGSHRWHGHQLRETGFRSYFREHAPDFQILETVVNLETAEVTHEATLNLLERHKDTAGFYVAGGGMEGAITALREVEPAVFPAAVVNELTPESSAALQDHILTGVIATPLPDLCRALIDMMTAAVNSGPADTQRQLFLPLRLHVPESV